MAISFRYSLSALFLLLLPQAANASPRDEAMANSYRCYSIPEAHQWLDCYYGAAQSVRTSLKLPPATEKQLALVANPPSGGSPQDSDIRTGIMAEAARCFGLKEDAAWLNCYYDSAQPMRLLLTLPSQAAAGIKPAAGGRSTPSQEGALPPIRTGAVAGFSRLTSYKFDSQGIFTIVLDNGQVWRQVPGDTDRATWNKPAGSYLVSITNGALGSSNLRVRGRAVTFKVERLK